ncbi:hypothetical protein [Nitrosopumilus sp.]|uniref:hypothetical protein n=1 Tax=Nitrosopumilus sp. TaxID=2024843 RepID=UPI00247C0128|nr:hypothetical protein [Nitrosopumilus sp.]MCV0410768.1 hypothetical protein [Nitrosopumilus sp.]
MKNYLFLLSILTLGIFVVFSPQMIDAAETLDVKSMKKIIKTDKLEKISFYQKLKLGIPVHSIDCKNPEHVKIERSNGKFACVSETTQQTIGFWGGLGKAARCALEPFLQGCFDDDADTTLSPINSDFGEPCTTRLGSCLSYATEDPNVVLYCDTSIGAEGRDSNEGLCQAKEILGCTGFTSHTRDISQNTCTGCYSPWSYLNSDGRCMVPPIECPFGDKIVENEDGEYSCEPQLFDTGPRMAKSLHEYLADRNIIFMWRR